MKILSIVGARPQFIKAAAVSRVIRQRHTEVLVHTGQHYDDNMSAVFFDELGIPAPDVNLEIGSGPHGAQTGAMLTRIEEVLLAECPDWVVVYGDTNSTLAGSLAAAKLHIPVAHVEAGLRSFNRAMPEEINRVLTDHISNLLLCPSQNAMDNLANENIRQGVYWVGDVMYETLMFSVERSRSRSGVLKQLGLTEKKYILATVHRAENTDDPVRLRDIFSAFAQIDQPIVFPIHPRTRQRLSKLDLNSLQSETRNLKLMEPMGYLDMVMLEQSARLILTDSGGVQKEAYWLGVPCVTLRNETEWPETVETQWNLLVGADRDRIIAAAQNFTPPPAHPMLYGDGQSAARCVARLEEYQNTELGRKSK
jgi:UDP-GlcNAc3NAcA epimerase